MPKVKRLLAFILVVALALCFAGSASAFSWEKPAQPTPEEIGYSIDVLKCTLVTGEAGSSYYNVDDNAVAVNGADVYWAVKLTVDGPSDLIQSTAYADVEISGLGLSSFKAIPLSGLDSGVYYFIPSGAGGYFQKIETILANGGHSPVQATRCTDTQTAKVTARVYSERVLGDAFNVGDYDVRLHPLYKEMKDRVKEKNVTPYIVQGNDEDAYYYKAEGGKECVEEYNNTQTGEDYNPKRQFWFHQSINWTNSMNDIYLQILEVGGYSLVIRANPNDTVTFTHDQFKSWITDPNTLANIKNANGESIPGLSVGEPIPITINQNQGERTVYVYKFFAADGYDWNTPGNNIVVHHYAASYPTDESERTMLVTFYQAARSPLAPGSGPAIAQFVLNGDRQVQAVLTSETAWKEYFANAKQEGNAWAVQCPNFLGDMDAIFDLMAWLDEGEIDSIYEAIEAGEMYMTDENLWEALGYAYRFEDSVSWQASTVPIIVDPLA